MRKIIPLLMLGIFIAMSSNAQTIYTWVDKHGVVHFSDTPVNDNSTIIDLPEVDAVSTPEVETTTEQPVEQPELADNMASDITEEPFFPEPLESLEIRLLEPKNEEVIHNNNGNFIVRVDLNRELSAGEQLQLFLDDKPYHAPQLNTEWQLKNIDRGTHKIQVRSMEGGKQIASTLSVTVYLKRASLLFK